MTTEIKTLCIGPNGHIADAAKILEANIQKICFVVDNDDVLLGTITDGDIRRGLLKGNAFDAPAKNIMNASPRTFTEDHDRSALRTMMLDQGILHVPIIDEHQHFIGLVTLDELMLDESHNDNWVVLMAGGLGERLRPLTEKTPKPLLQIGEKPLLQSILESFIEQKFRNFYIAVNYRAEDIKNYFGDGSAWNVNIQYLEEKERMGTAGALALLPATPTRPVIVMNGDLVTRTSFTELLKFHDEQKSSATMCVREYDFQVPFGVISIEDNRITSIDEKPIHRFFVNAGIYVLEPEIVAATSGTSRIDMTQIFDCLVAEDDATAVFPIHEYWLDIGRLDDLERAKSDVKEGHNK
jgi:dTDP-glucose pyrophosphorylase